MSISHVSALGKISRMSQEKPVISTQNPVKNKLEDKKTFPIFQRVSQERLPEAPSPLYALRDSLPLSPW